MKERGTKRSDHPSVFPVEVAQRRGEIKKAL